MSILFQKEIKSIEEVESVVNLMKPYVSAGAIFLLEGNLGAGKTTFISHLMASYDFSEVSSPTYSLINSYMTKSIQRFLHIDLYRLKNDEDIDSSGFWDVFIDKKNTVLIEWGSKINLSLWPMDWDIYQLNIEKKQNSRLYTFSKLQ